MPKGNGKGFVGRPMKRVEDPRLIKGIATYVDDIELPGMLHVAILRSPHAHAKITAINTDAAKAAPGIVGIFTGADVNDKCGSVPCAAPMPDQKSPQHTVLAGGRVYWVGHPVAAVVAADKYAARDAVDLIDVDYEPLTAVVDAEKALEADAPLSHPDLGTNKAFTWSVGSDLTKLFREADHIIKVKMVHQRLTPMAMEPRGCVASWHAGEESLTLWTSTQVPHLVRTLLPGLVGASENKTRIIAPEVGGGFGSKLNLYGEEVLCSHLARRLGAPIKWIEGRRENAATTIHGRDQIGWYEAAVKKDGTILGIKSNTICDIGSYLQLLTPAIPTLTGLMLCGCYTLKGVRMDVIGVHTNKMSTDAYRGAGRPEATYVIERLMDIVANELGIDRVQIRLKNMPKPTQFPFNTATGLTYDSGNYQGALKEAQRLAAWPSLLKRCAAARKEGKLYGVGISTYVEICALGPSKIMAAGGWEWGSVKIELSGKVTIATGATPHGQGQETSFAQIAADRLGIPIGDITVYRGDTATSHYGRDTYGSRATALGGTAIVLSIDKVIEKGKAIAGLLLKAKPKKIEFKDGTFFVKGKAKKALGWNDVATEAYIAKNIPSGFEPGLEASSFFEPPNCTFPFGTHICAVEVDKETGKVRIDKYIAVDDCGKQINPLLVKGQVQGGILQSIGQVLMEHTQYDENGQLLTGEFMDYAIPRASDAPEYVIGSTETPSPSNPLGVKGVGEAGTIGATPAVANAVVDALLPLGVRHLDLPMSPERVWRAIRDAEAAPQASLSTAAGKAKPKKKPAKQASRKKKPAKKKKSPKKKNKR